MTIALVSILTLWVSAAGVLAFADGQRTDVAVTNALASTEQVRADQAARDEFDDVAQPVAA